MKRIENVGRRIILTSEEEEYGLEYVEEQDTTNRRASETHTHNHSRGFSPKYSETEHTGMGTNLKLPNI